MRLHWTGATKVLVIRALAVGPRPVNVNPLSRLCVHTSVETVVFGAISVASLPGGVFFCWLGLRGGFFDASYRENVLAGLAFLVIGFVPPALAFASWVCDKRGPEQRAFQVGRTRDSEKAG